MSDKMTDAELIADVYRKNETMDGIDYRMEALTLADRLEAANAENERLRGRWEKLRSVLGENHRTLATIVREAGITSAKGAWAAIGDVLDKMAELEAEAIVREG